MNKTKRAKLQAHGWVVGSTKDFIGLSDEEAAYVELKVALGQTLREHRRRRKLSQVQLAKRIGSSQSRVAKMEAADPSVSIDLLLRSLLTLGATRRELARAVSRGRRPVTA